MSNRNRPYAIHDWKNDFYILGGLKLSLICLGKISDIWYSYKLMFLAFLANDTCICMHLHKADFYLAELQFGGRIFQQTLAFERGIVVRLPLPNCFFNHLRLRNLVQTHNFNSVFYDVRSLNNVRFGYYPISAWN